MKIVGIREAKKHLSELLQQVNRSEPLIIANASRPIAKIVAVNTTEPNEPRRLKFLAGEIEVPDDFDRMGEAEIFDTFGIKDNPAP